VTISPNICTAVSRQAALIAVGAELKTLAAGLDVHFVSAGTMLARTYDIVEHLIGSLEAISGAMSRQAANAAVETMQLTADRLTNLPMEQSERHEALGVISAASSDLSQNLKQIRRTLSFLHICGLNIKVTAAGAAGFADFADHMFAKLQQAELQVDEFENEISTLEASIRDMVEADRLLISACVSVIPRVPLKLAQDASALQKLQDDSAALADRTADLARDVRTKVAAALGALQVGDMTRQRLEHITQAIDLLQTPAVAADGEPEGENGLIAVDPVIALMAAQARDATDQFLRETEILYASLRGLVPDAARLAEMQQGSSSSDIPKVLQQLENDVSEIASVTQQLYTAAANSSQLGETTSQAADSLRSRLKAVNRIQRDVEQMAWNTALQCRGLGADGRGIAVISEEIQSFSRHLADVWERVAFNFDQVEAASGSVGQKRGNSAEADTSGMLRQSLETIRSGSDRMTESLTLIDQDAVQIANLLGTLAQDLGADAEIGAVMMAAVDSLTQLADAIAAQDSIAEVSEEERQQITGLMGQIYGFYTMASERDVHNGFVAGRTDVDQTSLAAGSTAQNGGDDGLFDDGLFDDDLFDDGLF
jgi:hypothetical protein